MAELIPVDHDPFGAPQQNTGDYGNRISGIESGGNYSAVGPQTGKGRALGKYQVMEFNVGPWTREALGREMNPREFLASPEAQEAVFNHKFGSYVSKYGPEGAARAWFAGEGGMNNPNARDVLGTSVADYARKFNAAGPNTEASSQQRGPTVSVKPFNAAQPKLVPVDHDPFGQPEMQGPPRAQVGVGEAIGRGIQQGATFNFGDEIAGAKAASGIPENVQRVASVIPGANLIAPAVGAARMGYEALTGQGGATDAYNQTVEAHRYGNQRAQEQRPYSYGGGQLVGAVAVPVGGALNAATLPVRMARGAAVGAGIGAAAGAGEGEGFVDRASRATVGAGVGGAIGGIAPPVVEGALQLGRAAVAPVANAVRGAANPQAEAARRIATTTARGIDADPNAVGRLTPQEFAASVQNGGPATLMDIGGEPALALARSAANTSDAGRGILNRAINDRYEGQTGRVVEWLRNTFHFPSADAQQQAIEQTARNVNRAAYARAYREGADGIWTPGLERLAGSPEVTAAMQAAARNAGSESVVSGYGAMNPRITFTPDGRIQFNRAPNGMPTYPDLQYWDLVRRELSDAAQRAGRGTSEARRLGELARMMNAELDQAVPSYQIARQGAAAFFGAENALEAGQNFVTQNFANDATRRALRQMSQQERQLFQDGFISRYIETLERAGDRRNVLNQIAASPAAREKLNMVLGRQRAAELEAGLRVEGIMDLARGAVQGNSTTARQLAEIGFAGGTGTTGLLGVYNQDPGTIGIAAVSGALLAGRRGIDTRVARHVAEMLVSNDPATLLRGIRTVARNQRLLDNLRIADRKIASVGAAESPKGLLPIQAISAPRAEGGEPDVPRPRGQ